MHNTKTRQLALNAVLAAMCAALGYLSLDFGNLKITFESVPILIGALLFGGLDGAAIGAVGTLIYQLLRYGVTVTTPLWILPYVLCGLVVGVYARRHDFQRCSGRTDGHGHQYRGPDRGRKDLRLLHAHPDHRRAAAAAGPLRGKGLGLCLRPAAAADPAPEEGEKSLNFRFSCEKALTIKAFSCILIERSEDSRWLRP